MSKMMLIIVRTERRISQNRKQINGKITYNQLIEFTAKLKKNETERKHHLYNDDDQPRETTS
jgi:hypothetical protein